MHKQRIQKTGWRKNISPRGILIAVLLLAAGGLVSMILKPSTHNATILFVLILLIAVGVVFLETFFQLPKFSYKLGLGILYIAVLVAALLQLQTSATKPDSILIAKPVLTEFGIDEVNKKMYIGMDILVLNTGDAPIHQARIRVAAAPVGRWQWIDAKYDAIDTSPIVKDIPKKVALRYEISFVGEPQPGTLVVYVGFRYSFSPVGEEWENRVDWIACEYDPRKGLNGIEVLSALEEWKAAFKPYVDDYYSKR